MLYSKSKSLLMLLLVAGCSKKEVQPVEVRVVEKVVDVTVPAKPIPGTENDVWVEDMRDQVVVPASTDRNDIYYRPPHKEIVEIIPGRFKRVDYGVKR